RVSRLQHALVLARGVILGVLAEVPQVTGRRDALGDLDHLDVRHAIEVGLELLVAFAGHGDSVGGHGLYRSFFSDFSCSKVPPAVAGERDGEFLWPEGRPASLPKRTHRGGL